MVERRPGQWISSLPSEKSLEDQDREDQSAGMPRPKIPASTVDHVLELLLCGWTPQDIAGCSTACVMQANDPNHSHDGYGCPSLPSIQRIARSAGLAQPKGGPSGRKHRGGGAPMGHLAYAGSGRPRGTHSSQHRDEVCRLREEGHSLRVIARLVGLRSPQQVANLLVED